jgi:hypothetical protein
LLTGCESHSIAGLEARLKARQMLKMRAEDNDKVNEFESSLRLE